MGMRLSFRVLTRNLRPWRPGRYRDRIRDAVMERVGQKLFRVAAAALDPSLRSG